MIVTIDGPAGAGKSSAARALAQRLGFRFLDTGAMYRAVALAAIQRGMSWKDADGLAVMAQTLKIKLQDDRTLLDGEDVTEAIRASEVTATVRYVADNRDVRSHLVELQRRASEGINVVSEGRDQGTIAFPHAECKIYLTASAEERALRRKRELEGRGECVSFEAVLAQQNERDLRDSSRAFGRLIPATDAITVSTDGLEPGKVVDRLEALVRQRQATQ